MSTRENIRLITRAPFANECNVQLLLLLCYAKINISIKTHLYLNKTFTTLQLLHDVWLIMLHYVLVNVYTLINTHKALLKYITE